MAKTSGLTGWSRWVIAFDSHGDMLDKQAAKAFWEFCDFWKPTIRGHGGDWIDARALRGGASPEEKADGMSADVYAAREFLDRLDPTFIINGNHDARLIRAAENHHNGVIRTFCAGLMDDMYKRYSKAQWLPYNVRHHYKLGDHIVVHGFRHGKYAAKNLATDYGRNAIQGHAHREQMHTIEGLVPVVGYVSGCLCLLDQEYAITRPANLSWGHGWAYGLTNNRTKETVTWLAKRTGKQWILPSEMIRLT